MCAEAVSWWITLCAVDSGAGERRGGVRVLCVLRLRHQKAQGAKQR